MYNTFDACNKDYDVDWMDYNTYYGDHTNDAISFYEGCVCAAMAPEGLTNEIGVAHIRS